MANGESGKNWFSWLFGSLIVIALVILILLFLKNIQVVQPIPGHPAPVVPKLPDLTAELSKIKSICESRAMAAKVRLRRIQAKRQLPAGQKLYDEAKAESDATITFLVTGLAVRFKDTDEAKIAARMKMLGEKASAFLDWADRLDNSKGIGAEDPVSAILSLLGEWLKAVREENENAIKQITASLEGCRLRNWDELSLKGDSDTSEP